MDYFTTAKKSWSVHQTKKLSEKSRQGVLTIETQKKNFTALCRQIQIRALKTRVEIQKKKFATLAFEEKKN